MFPDILTINVVFTSAGVPLEVDPQHMTLSEDQAVEWIFHNVPPNCHAKIEFLSGPTGTSSPPQHGPFEALAHSHSLAAGVGNSGVQGIYSYQAHVVNDQHLPVATSAPASIDNQSSTQQLFNEQGLVLHRDHTTHLEVLVAPSPLRVRLNDSATWYAVNVPESVELEFQFEVFPFSSITHTQEGTSRVVIGHNFTDPNHSAIHYRIVVMPERSSPIFTNDPVIEPLGPPPNPEG